ncbi:MAG TPA: ABC transporter permease [Acidimicrobiales bacterium]|nr:ABC transporter permease [Acidimicrobiales bacterium]
MRLAGVRRDLRLVARQVYYEQLAFWRNPFGAIFTIGFSVIFLLLLASSASARLRQIGDIRAVQYYVPGFAAYGVMSACFNTLAVNLVGRRETGLLKRLRLSPLPTWALLAGIFCNLILISALQVALLLMIGHFAYGALLPRNVGAFVLALAAGVVCFSALGVAVSSLLPNQEAAGPIIGIVYFVLLFLSGLWFYLPPRSGLARVADYFPVRHFLLAVQAPFEFQAKVSPWSFGDLAALLVWGAAATAVALRRFRWEPRHH